MLLLNTDIIILYSRRRAEDDLSDGLFDVRFVTCILISFNVEG